MKFDLLAAKYKMKTFSKENGHHHCIVMDPAKDLESNDLSKVWGNDDPTLSLPSIFNKMAAAVKVAETRADTAGKKRTGSGQEGPPPKKAKRSSHNDGQVRSKAAPDGRNKGQKGKKGGGGAGPGGQWYRSGRRRTAWW
jgi:hypothetical protein